MGNHLALPDAAVTAGINQETWNALSVSVFPGAKPESITLAFQYCKARGLDILKKPVHIVPMSVKIAGTNKYEYRDVIMPGIGELRTTASRTGLMAGTDKPVFGAMIEFPITDNPDVKDPIMLCVAESCEVTVWRLDKAGVPRSYTHIEFFEEAVARTKEGAVNSMWRKRARGQLAKCAEAGALRKAFPEELGGIYAAEEMEGKSIGGEAPDVIEGEFNMVDAGDISMPEEIAAGHAGDDVAERQEQQAQASQPPPQAKPAAQQGNQGASQPKATGKQYTAHDGKDTTKPVGDRPKPSTSGAATIQLDTGPMKVLMGRLNNCGLTEADLLNGFGKTIDIGNINEALTWIKDNAK
jgi:phage recombination protein Bet